MLFCIMILALGYGIYVYFFDRDIQESKYLDTVYANHLLYEYLARYSVGLDSSIIVKATIAFICLIFSAILMTINALAAIIMFLHNETLPVLSFPIIFFGISCWYMFGNELTLRQTMKGYFNIIIFDFIICFSYIFNKTV